MWKIKRGALPYVHHLMIYLCLHYIHSFRLVAEYLWEERNWSSRFIGVVPYLPGTNKVYIYIIIIYLYMFCCACKFDHKLHICVWQSGNVYMCFVCIWTVLGVAYSLCSVYYIAHKLCSCLRWVWLQEYRV